MGFDVIFKIAKIDKNKSKEGTGGAFQWENVETNLEQTIWGDKL